VDEVKAGILESVNGVEELHEEGAVKGQSRGLCAQKRPRDEKCLVSTLGA
jgi:hypothetical protein